MQHGYPERKSRFRTKEDVLRLEEFEKNYQLDRPDTITFGEYQRVDSLKDNHFTEKLEQNESEEENLLLTSNRILIKNITLLSTQQLSYRMWLFATRDFKHDNADHTKLVDFMDFNLSQYGKQYTDTGLWMYAITDLNLLYNDLNKLNELHIAIENLSTSPKAAITGYVIAQIVYEQVD